MKELSSKARELLNGAVEMHVHSAPDVVGRKLDDIELLRMAKALGMKAVLVKAHFNPTTARAAMAAKAVGGISGFGGVTLNKQVGGLNPSLVEAEIKMGAKIIWMPTQSAINDILFHERGEAYAAKYAVAVTDEQGKYLPALHEILELIAAADIALATGHLSAVEGEQLANLACAKGIKKIIITHPEAPRIAMPIDMQQRLAAKGVMFEWCCFNMRELTAGRGKVAAEQFAVYMRNVGVENSIMATDFGQVDNYPAPVGLGKYIDVMLELGFKESEIQLMLNTNPSKMLGLI